MIFHISDDSTEYVLKNRIMKCVQPDLLDFPTLIPLLNKHHLLTQADSYDLANQLLSPTKRANLLLYKILPSKGPGAYRLFLKCLQEEKQHMGHRNLVKLFTLRKLFSSYVYVLFYLYIVHVHI